jgi:hypothetical protein
MMMALEAPLKGEKLLTASPLEPVKKPLLLAISEPSAAKVFKVNTDLVAFFTQDGWACAGESVKRWKSRTPVSAISNFIVFVILFMMIHYYYYSILCL